MREVTEDKQLRQGVGRESALNTHARIAHNVPNGGRSGQIRTDHGVRAAALALCEPVWPSGKALGW